MRAVSAMNVGAQYDEDGVIGLDDDPDMWVVPLGMGERDRSGRGDGVRVGLTWSWSRRRGPGLFGGDFGDGDSRGLLVDDGIAYREVLGLGRSLADHNFRCDETVFMSLGAGSRYAQRSLGVQTRAQFAAHCAAS
jgi:hypothetical protein